MTERYKNLHAAKKAKNDEFYTRIEDIENELIHYEKHFNGKVVFCNCDDPFESNFVKYFLMNFNRIGLKELIATGYQTSPILGTSVGTKGQPYALRVSDTKPYLVGNQTDLDVLGTQNLLETENENVMTPLVGNWANDNYGNSIQIEVKEAYIDKKTRKTKTRKVKQDLYYEAGDFRSNLCIELLKQADIVCTNPPFSAFREYLKLLMEHQKEFLVLGNMNAITYKEVFPLIKENKIWLGCNNGPKTYVVSEDFAKEYPLKVTVEDGAYVTKMGNTGWFTNLDHAKRHKMLPLNLGYKYYGHEEDYPKYDNYDAINVDKVQQIPCDYDGVMGVPISFLCKYCPEQFEIVGMDLNEMVNILGIECIGQDWIDLYRAQGGTGHLTANMHSLVYVQNGIAYSKYRRILIRRK